MRYLFLFGGLVILATGCATLSQHSGKIPMSEAQELRIQMRQIKAISETALGVSKQAQKYSQEAYNVSEQANATADTAFVAAGNAIKASQKATETAKKSAKQAMDYANKVSQKAMDYANKVSQKAIAAANNAITISNKNAAKSIAVANQIMSKMGRLKATVKSVQYKPVLPGRPKVFNQPSAESGIKYTIRSGDTLSGISLRFYGTSSEWRKIYDANRDAIKNPSILTIGTEIIIPK